MVSNDLTGLANELAEDLSADLTKKSTLFLQQFVAVDIPKGFNEFYEASLVALLFQTFSAQSYRFPTILPT